MKDDNLPPDNETVEDGGGCYVAGSREESIQEMDDKFADAAKKSIAAAKEYQAYLNYEDVHKELETAKGIIKKLIPIAEMAPASSNWVITQQYIITIQEAKKFAK